MQIERRGFLSFLGVGTYTLLRSLQSPIAFGSNTSRSSRSLKKLKDLNFTPIAPSTEDKLIVPKEFKYSTIMKWKDPLGSRGPYGEEFFGYDNDYTQFIPIDVLKGGSSSKEGLLFVNHENVTTLFVSKYLGTGDRSREEVRNEKLNVGISVTHIKKSEKGIWTKVSTSKYNQRITALYPNIEFTGPVRTSLDFGIGTLANCSGGRTPWNTVLTCEENFDEANRKGDGGLNWASVKEEAIDETRYGWVVEVDPFKELPPKKHSSLGRFAHENACIRISPDSRLIVYMGDDKADQFLYKFISNGTYKDSMSRAQKSELLNNGILYVANMESKKWIPLDLQQNKDLQKAGFKNQAQLLIETRKAAAIAGATPLDRPEDCEIDPKDGSLYVAFTNNTSTKKNYHGHILHLREKNDNPSGNEFDFDILLAGGELSGLSCPDNLVFDPSGKLWVCCDISSSKINKGPYTSFGNNGFFYVPLTGKEKGKAFQFASAPIEAEFTGPSFTPDGKTLFLSVQHPGEASVDFLKPTSLWPHDGSGIPSPAVVAIERI